jgi:hypothetical protein
MGVTRTSVLIDGDCFAWFKKDNEWHRVKVVRAITKGGGMKNLIRFEDGEELEVWYNWLRFDVGKPKK